MATLQTTTKTLRVLITDLICDPEREGEYWEIELYLECHVCKRSTELKLCENLRYDTNLHIGCDVCGNKTMKRFDQAFIAAFCHQMLAEGEIDFPTYRQLRSEIHILHEAWKRK